MKKFKDYLNERIEKVNPNWVSVDFKPHTKYSSAHGLNGPLNVKSAISQIDTYISSGDMDSVLSSLEELLSHNLTRTMKEQIKQLRNIVKMSQIDPNSMEDVLQRKWDYVSTALNAVYGQKQV
jgi:DNA repair ATPase RecN